MALNDNLSPNRYATADGAPTGTASAVSWGAIVAGAAAAAALSLILLLLGTGLGLSSVSPWSTAGVAATTFGVGTILWVTFMQIAASGMGGYLAGRLRTRWSGVHTDEVYFRDTAHGFLAWALATLVTAAALTSAIGSIVAGGAQAGATVVGGVTGAAATAATAGGTAAAMSDNGGKSDGGDSSGGGVMGYFVDSLFRKDASAGSAAAAASAASGAGTTMTAATPASPPSGGDAASVATATREVARIIGNAVATGNLPAKDSRYVGQIVAQRTGISQADAEKRVADTYARVQAKLRDAQNAAKEAADKARKASAYGALWLFISLLAGAFVASLSATYGGRQRDA